MGIFTDSGKKVGIPQAELPDEEYYDYYNLSDASVGGIVELLGEQWRGGVQSSVLGTYRLRDPNVEDSKKCLFF